MFFRTKKIIKSNKGFTLAEMLVCFILLAIFLVAASAIIGTVTNLYYRVKAETYSKQTTDIIMTKIESEITGAKYKKDDQNNPIICNGDVESTSAIGDSIVLYDKTDTKIKISVEDESDGENHLVVHYYDIKGSTSENSYKATDWMFDEKAFNGFKVQDVEFVRGDKLSSFSAKESYGCSKEGNYGKDVIVVFLTIDSDRYGEYKSFKVMRMYNASFEM